MLFYSFKFYIFLIIVLSLYWSVKNRLFRNILLLSASYFFYISWNSYYAILLAVSTLTDYVCGLYSYRSREKKYKRVWLVLSIVTNIGILGFLKYFDFFVESFIKLMSQFGFQTSTPFAKLLLPIGISFYTFKTMTYTIDIYKENLKPTSNIIDYALYVAFFPQLLAGPITRAKTLLPQIDRMKEFSGNKISLGLGIFFLGLLKKVFLADLLNLMHIDIVFSEIKLFSSMDILLAVYAYAIQIYADFSGYSDMAVGIALMFGFKLEHNFNYPYISGNINEFWKRWHISLSSWLRDYLYIPLGGSRCATIKRHRNIILTMLACGLWHGASLHFMIWGAYHGILISVTHFINRLNLKVMINKFVKIIITFNLVCIGWVIFNASSLKQAAGIIKKLFNPYQFSMPVMTSMITLLLIIVPLSYHILSAVYPIRRKILNAHLKYSVFSSGIVIFSIILISLFTVDMKNTFIYFQF